jgi:multidrug efflux pump subunit AcrA (membrane-fusion protein)
VPEGTIVERGDFVAELDRSELTSRLQDVQLELQTAQSQYEQTRLDTSLTLSEARDQQVNLRYAMEEAELRMEQATYEAPSVRRQAQIDYEKAKRDYEQAVANYDTKVKQARAQMSEVGAELSKAENELRELEALSEKFTIRAPENGMVVYKRDRRGRKLTEGGTISPWDPVVATLPDLSVMQSITYVNEVDIQKVKARQPVEVGLDAAPTKRLTGTVTSVANIGEERPNSDAKVFRVEIEITQRDTTLRPAMTTSNTIVVAERENALHIPLETVHTQDSLTYVFARRGGTLVRQQVRLGLLNENRAIVDAGVSSEDELYLSLPADTSGLPLLTLEGAPPEENQLAQRTP